MGGDLCSGRAGLAAFFRMDGNLRRDRQYDGGSGLVRPLTFGKLTFGKLTFGKLTFGKLIFGKQCRWTGVALRGASGLYCNRF